MFSGILNLLPPEIAHRTAIKATRALKLFPVPIWDPRLKVEAFGLTFPNPVGLAAGFDKSAQAVEGLAHLGFGFIEVGTVTPRPQAGNPKPRLFRLKDDQAVVNRMGFNNDGYVQVKQRLLRTSKRGIVGVNIGPNKDSVDRIADYALGIKTFSDVADYFTINISSPNTPGLRDFHAHGELERLLVAILKANGLMQPRRPLLLKIAPDLDAAGLDVVLSLALSYEIDGLIISNTTINRPSSLLSDKASEIGGLSGRPLFSVSTIMVARCFLKCGDRIPIIGVGGIEDFSTALQKLEAGARLIQVYTGLLYRGPALVTEILNGLTKQIESRRLNSVSEIIGTRSKQIAQDI